MPARHLATPILRAGLAAVLLVGGLAACAPQNTGGTYSTATIGRSASVSYGTIVGTRPVMVRGDGGGIGTAAGAVAGGVAGSFIGGDVRSNVLGGLGGALIGGLAGNAIGTGVSSGQAVEFTVREDTGGDFQVVQTNEEGLQAGDRVVISRGDRTRLSRAAGGPPAPVYPQRGYGAPMGYAPNPGGAWK
ncbi:MAG TPA: glycine zipper 2TM domain-containing protein [Roseomonas sp.]|jgi:outer membrane lipoprotein SlyB